MTEPVADHCPFCGCDDIGGVNALLRPGGAAGDKAIICDGCGAQRPPARTVARAYAAWRDRQVDGWRRAMEAEAD